MLINLIKIEDIIEKISLTLWGIPIIAFIISIGIIASFAFNFAQIKYFFTGWNLLFCKKEITDNVKDDSISSMQAFINALSASLGNGGLAGMAIVLVNGGPGTVFWVFILGFFSMILRFFEVYGGIKLARSNLIGPLSYISNLPFGKLFTYLYAFVLLVYILFGGISMQTNSIGLSLQKSFGFNPISIGIGFALLIFYIIIGGSKRIMKASEYIIPIKVSLFFIGIIALLYFHRGSIIPAFHLVIDNAFTTEAMGKGALCFTMQQAITVGFSKALNATEAGIGTASIFFGSTETKEPLKTAIMSMITAFISTNLVCSMLIFAIITSGVSTEGITSTGLVISAFSTLLGNFAGPVITFLSFSFGIGVMVAYSFLGYKVWDFLFGKNNIVIYYGLLICLAFFGAIASVGLVFKALDMLVALLIIINLLALLWNIKTLRKEFLKDQSNLSF
jgi:AGCS family alanine or glycine:cation symporter